MIRALLAMFAVASFSTSMARAQVVSRADAPAHITYAWKAGGKLDHALAGDPRIPEGATKISVRLVQFKGVDVREIVMEKGERTYAHDNAEDTLFYEVSGRRVQIVNERSRELNPGDATLHPAGVMHQTSQLISGTFVEFAYPRAFVPGGEATWVAAANAPLAEAPGGREKRFALPSHDMREIHIPAGGDVTGRATAGKDLVLYVVRGAGSVRAGGVEGRLDDGAVVRVPAGADYRLSLTADSVIVAVVTQTFPPVASGRP